MDTLIRPYNIRFYETHLILIECGKLITFFYFLAIRYDFLQVNRIHPVGFEPTAPTLEELCSVQTEL